MEDATYLSLEMEIHANRKEPDHVDISGTKQLFIDDSIINGFQNLRFTVNQPVKHPMNPLLVGDKPWETYGAYVYGTVMYDHEEKIYKMWYLSFVSLFGYGSLGSTVCACYAISSDGIRWQKPDLGLVEFNGSRKNNIVILYSGKGEMGGPNVIKDPLEEDPKRRYKMILNKGEAPGASLAYSPDGLRWQDHPDNPVWPIQAPGPSDVINCSFDEVDRTFFMYYKAALKSDKRIIACARSLDAVTWEQARIILIPDEQDPSDTQFYGMSGFRYADRYIGFLWVFHTDSDTIDVQLATSRDGRHWSRAGRINYVFGRQWHSHELINSAWKHESRKPFLPLGPSGSFDSGTMYTSGYPIVRDDQILIYYSGWNCKHEDANKGRAAIGLATLRPDRFVSLDAGSDIIGHLETRRLVFSGTRLVVNADTSGGYLKAGILEDGETSVPGRGLQECDPFVGDEIDRIISWKGNPDVGDLAGKPIRLRFELRGARLYSFAFR